MHNHPLLTFPSILFSQLCLPPPKFEIHFDINNVVWCMLCVIQGSKGAAQHRAGYMTIYSTYAMNMYSTSTVAYKIWFDI